MITEAHLEQLCLECFQAIGYQTVCGYDIAPDGEAPERVDYRQVILTDRLLKQLAVINPHIPETLLEQAVQLIAKPETPVLIKNNKAFHRLLLEGEKSISRKRARIKPIMCNWWILPMWATTGFWW